MNRLMKSLADMKSKRLAHEAEHDEEQELGKLEYLRGPDGERDRQTIWKAAQGTLPGTGEGGLLEGWLER